MASLTKSVSIRERISDAKRSSRAELTFTLYIASGGRSFTRKGYETLALAKEAAPHVARAFRDPNAAAYWDVQDTAGIIVATGIVEK